VRVVVMLPPGPGLPCRGRWDNTCCPPDRDWLDRIAETCTQGDEWMIIFNCENKLNIFTVQMSIIS